MNSAAIVGWSHYHQRLDDGATPPDLGERQRALLKERFRRIDRHTLLALLGSAECIRGELAPDCALYMSSAYGPLGSNIAVREELGGKQLMPMPFLFVNTLGSAAIYYVGKHLGLSRHCAFVARRRGAFTAALWLALTDLACGAASEALVGAVAECPPALAAHRAPLGLDPSESLAEGYDWLHLRRGEGAPRLSFARFDSFEELERHLNGVLAPGDALILGDDVPAELRSASPRRFARTELLSPEPIGHFHREASWLTSHLARPSHRRLAIAGSHGASCILLERG